MSGVSKNNVGETRYRFKFVKCLGNGRFGVTHLVRQRQRQTESESQSETESQNDGCQNGGRLVVLKKIALLEDSSKDERKRAIQECQMLEQLQHPNIIGYLASFVAEGAFYLLMEWCSEGDLHQQIVRRRQGNKKQRKETDDLCGVRRFDQNWAYEVMAQVWAGLDYLHTKHHIIHRDIKSQNIVLDRKLNQVKIIDFGIAVYMDFVSKDPDVSEEQNDKQQQQDIDNSGWNCQQQTQNPRGDLNENVSQQSQIQTDNHLLQQEEEHSPITDSNTSTKDTHDTCNQEQDLECEQEYAVSHTVSVADYFNEKQSELYEDIFEGDQNSSDSDFEQQLKAQHVGVQQNQKLVQLQKTQQQQNYNDNQKQTNDYEQESSIGSNKDARELTVNKVNKAPPVNPLPASKAKRNSQKPVLQLQGTFTHMPPEILDDGNERLSTKCDMYQLGVLMYELCTLKLPFEGNNVLALTLKISGGIEKELESLSTQFSEKEERNDCESDTDSVNALYHALGYPDHYGKGICYLIAKLLSLQPKSRPSAQSVLQWIKKRKDKQQKSKIED